MRGLILAAGRGSRMGALTEDAPKCLAKLGSRTLLDRQIASLRDGGCREIGIVTGYRSELLRDRADRSFHNPAWASSNMVASLATADEWLREGRVIVSYSDIFYEPQTVRELSETAGDLAIAFDPGWRTLWEARFEDPLADAETFRRDANGWLVEIGARAQSIEEIGGQYIGLLKFQPDAWQRIRALLRTLDLEARDRLDMTSLLARLLARGEKIGTSPVVGIWGECDSAKDLALYLGWLEAGRLKA